MTGNPFATVGQMVFGAAHIGREGELATLTERVLSQETAGATAIIGPPRIGKSSLAYHLFMRPEVRADHPELLPVWLNVRLAGGIRRLFERLVGEVWDLLQDPLYEVDRRDRRLERAYLRATADQPEWIEAQGDAQEFLRQVRRRGFRVVLVLDEFDAAREVFRTQPGAFQGLRELAYNPEWNIGLVTTSRRGLRDIVDMADPAESTFPGIFRSVYLRCFDEPDLTALASRIGAARTLVPWLMETTGGHPYLASHLLDRVWTELRGGPLPPAHELMTPRGPVPPEFGDYYRDLKELLSADERLRALLEIVLGPQLSVTPDDAENLLQQGLIRRKGGRYRAFSDHFQRYLTLLSRELGLWESWTAVETGVRALVERLFEKRYGTEWPEAARRARPELEDLLKGCEQRLRTERRMFGARASSRLLDFTYPRDLYDLMDSHWELFGPVLGRNKAYWRERFTLLTKLRNPMAHSREDAVGTTDRRLFTAYCAELMDVLNVAQDRGRSAVGDVDG